MSDDATERYHALVEVLEELVFVAEPSGRMLYANPALVRETGYTLQDFQFPQADNPFLHPDDAARVASFIVAFAASDAQRSAPIENRFYDRWGRARWCRSVLTKVSFEGAPAIQYVTRPIAAPGTDPAAAGDATADRDYRLLVEHATDSILKLDASGRILYANGPSRELFGRGPVELARLRVGDLLDPPDARRFAAEGRFTTRVRAADGGTRWVDASVVPLDPAGAELLAVLRDVTEQRALQERALYGQKLESLGLLAGGVAHDFNNLLTAIRAYLRLAGDAAAAGKPVAGLLAEVDVAADRAATLCRQMLAYAGKGRGEDASIDLNAVVTDILRLTRPLVGAGAEVTVALADEAPPLLGDTGQIQQVVLNLLTNAYDALAGATGRIVVETGSVDLASTDVGASYVETPPAAGRYAYVEVADSGCGMDDEARARMFDPFFTTKVTGHGLGLASVLGIVRAHHGAIRVDSHRGDGTRIRVLLPVARPAEGAAPAEVAVAPAPAGPPRTVLIADDEPAIRYVVRRVLERAGYDVIDACDGPSAVAAFEQHRHQLGAAVIDVIMPGLDGVEVVREMWRQDPGFPVLLVSGYMDRVRPPAGTPFLAKPFDPEVLLAVVAELTAMRT